MRRRASVALLIEDYVEAAEVDRYGNPVPGYAPPRTVYVYAVSPKQSVEPDELGRRAVLTGKTVYAPEGVSVSAHARVTFRGEVFEVAGEPAVWDYSPHTVTGAHYGVQFDLERSTG